MGKDDVQNVSHNQSKGRKQTAKSRNNNYHQINMGIQLEEVTFCIIIMKNVLENAIICVKIILLKLRNAKSQIPVVLHQAKNAIPEELSNIDADSCWSELMVEVLIYQVIRE